MLDESQMLQQLADALPFGVCIVDGQRQICYWNRGAEKITGHLRQDVMGRFCCDELLVCCHGEGGAPRQCCPAELAEDGTPSARLRHFFLRHKEGHRLPVLMRSLALRQEDGLIVARAELFQIEQTAAQEDLSWMGEASTEPDPALGIPPLAATLDSLRLRLGEASASLAIFVIGIRDLPQMVRKYGEPMGRAAQRTVVHSLTYLLTVPHFLGCWSNQRLLVSISDCSEFTFYRIQQQLAVLKTMELTWWGDRIGFATEITSAMLVPGGAAREENENEKVLERLGAPCDAVREMTTENS
jgi:PAS domain S-box-containing protein